MSPLEPLPDMPPLQPERRRADEQDLEELFKGFITRYEELRQRNRDLEETNSRLVAALKEANEKVVDVEESLSTLSQLSRFATATAAQMLGRAVESVEAMSRAAQSETADKREDARRRALGLQMEALLLLEGARDEALQRIQETDRKAIEILKKTRESILALAEDLDKFAPDATTPVPGDRAGEPLPAPAEGPGTPPPPPQREVTGAPTPAQEETAEQPVGAAPVDAPVPPPGKAVPALVDAVELVASPFQNLSSLSVFLRAVKQSPGVADVKAQGFDRGRLRLEIRYARPTVAEAALTGLAQFDPKVVSMEPGRVEILIADVDVQVSSTGGNGR